MSEPTLNSIHELAHLVGELAEDDASLSLIGAELANALVGNEAMTRVVISALVTSLAGPAVSPEASAWVLQSMAQGVETARAMMSTAGTA